MRYLCTHYDCVELSPATTLYPTTPHQNIKLLWLFHQMFRFSTIALMSCRHLTLTPGEGCLSAQAEVCLLYSQRLKIRIKPSSNTGPVITRLSDAGQCVKWACVHSRKTPRPCLEILDEAEQSCGNLLPHISCVYFGFRLTIHLSMGGSNGWIFRRPESHLHISLFPYN